MAKPDLDDGWLKYAHELDAALAVADFTKGARVVLREVFAQVFGPAKRKSATLSPSVIGTNVGMQREHVSRAIKELADARVLERLSDGTYRFIKDYESWLRKGESRLSCKELSYCRYAPAVAMAYKSGNPFDHGSAGRNDSGNTSTEDRNSLGTPTVPESLRDRNDSGNKTVPESLRTESSPPDPPYGNGHAEFETGELRNSVVLPDNQTAKGGGAENARHASIKDLVSEARALHGEDVARQVLNHSQEILGTFGDNRLDCYLSAIREATTTTTTIGNPHRWFLKVGKRYLSGDPGTKAQIPPGASKQSTASKRQDEMTAEILADPEFNRMLDQIEGA